MDKDEVMRQIERLKVEHHQKLIAYRSWYIPDGVRSEDGFEQLAALPEGIEWVLEQGVVMMKGSMQGLQELTFIIQAFVQDEETRGLFHKHFLLLKDTESVEVEGLTVIAMPHNAWAVWGGKMADVAWGNDFNELTFNELGFFEETLPVDIGISLVKDQ